MAHRDHIIRGRHLRASNNQSPPAPLTFANGNETISSTISEALDTGSDLFWLPCDCLNSNTCVTGLQTSSGQVVNLNIYSPNASSTSKRVPCGSNTCAVQISVSQPIVIVLIVMPMFQMTLQLLDFDDDQSKAVDALVTFGRLFFVAFLATKIFGRNILSSEIILIYIISNINFKKKTGY
ncbi:aspartyl protease family protein 1 [Quercus suber]|uniref:Aspartyl protease family protein 1 n=1 Tax=Quercus suber TaxID=58331 RepID=A0AAW0IP20_QUESU